MQPVVCIGETMAVLSPPGNVPLSEAADLLYGVGGAESNVAMGLAAMGVDAHWVGRVGRDGFGTRILDELRAHHVGVSGVEVDAGRPTGLYVKVPAEGSVLYYRRGSAASAMGPGLLAGPVVAQLLEQAGLIHLSGITAALSPECRGLLEAVLSSPRNGRRISFDVNWRESLWAGQDKTVLAHLANLADVVLVGADEALVALGTNDEGALRALLPAPEAIVVKNADISAIALLRDGSRIEVPALCVDVVEPVGAGDAFAAGYLSGLLAGLDERSSLRRGHLAAACTLTVPGDRGPLPAAGMLAAMLGCTDADWAATRVSPGRLESPALAGGAGVTADGTLP
ncbi:sugar kinase [Arthrobacter sp. SDTb3-6]|uniref:sugar kinase n=1 Tax=Arthrobacter sp. SDTb3-6 TaxID=2713571 RepID=UPI00159DA442|nr:sugar kinase [Arthrobacter sp. SDTb3-6]NVM99510.1 sugar kinase [Arthrobacter sp. SDTb3-6]